MLSVAALSGAELHLFLHCGSVFLVREKCTTATRCFCLSSFYASDLCTLQSSRGVMPYHGEQSLRRGPSQPPPPDYTFKHMLTTRCHCKQFNDMHPALPRPPNSAAACAKQQRTAGLDPSCT